jgi:hypothetical protein
MDIMELQMEGLKHELGNRYIYIRIYMCIYI